MAETGFDTPEQWVSGLERNKLRLQQGNVSMSEFAADAAMIRERIVQSVLPMSGKIRMSVVDSAMQAMR